MWLESKVVIFCFTNHISERWQKYVIKNHQITYLKLGLNFIVCKLYFNDADWKGRMNSSALPSLLAAGNTILMGGALATVLDYKAHVEEKEQWTWKKLIPDNFVRIHSIPEYFCFHEYFLWYASEILLYIKEKIFKSILYSKNKNYMCQNNSYHLLTAFCIPVSIQVTALHFN